MSSFWSGLTKSCKRCGDGKAPISLNEAIRSLKECATDASAIQLRNGAMLASAFFGVRRGAEVVQFRLKDVESQSDTGTGRVVRCQRNDSCGIGQVCLLPSMPALGQASPDKLLVSWLNARSSFATDASPDAPLFVNVTLQNKGGFMSTDSFRKIVYAVYGKSYASRSPEKGATSSLRELAPPRMPPDNRVGGARLKRCRRFTLSSPSRR